MNKRKLLENNRKPSPKTKKDWGQLAADSINRAVLKKMRTS